MSYLNMSENRAKEMSNKHLLCVCSLLPCVASLWGKEWPKKIKFHQRCLNLQFIKILAREGLTVNMLLISHLQK